MYDVRVVIELVADEGSVLELGAASASAWSPRSSASRPAAGLIANDPKHLGGAIDADAADKAARFMQLCDAFDLPMVSLCDTPGFMVGPAAEQTALVRHVEPHVRRRRERDGAVVHGRAAQGLRPGRDGDERRRHARLGPSPPPGRPASSAAWASKVMFRLGFRKEMEAIADPAERARWYEAKVASLYEQGTALSDRLGARDRCGHRPAETRRWIVAGWTRCRRPRHLAGRKQAWHRYLVRVETGPC